MTGQVAALDPAPLVARAQEATGLSDLGDDTWQDGMERLLRPLREEAKLHALGVDIAAGDVVAYLVNRLRLTDWHARHPEIGAAPIATPVVIVGQGRTGTTILHDLLAQDPANRVPLTWEVDHPHPPPETATYDTDPRIDEVQANLDGTELLIPGFLSMHPLGARLAQECVRITGGDFRSMIFPTQYHVPSYARWLLHDADMAPAYAYHRRFLQLLQWRHPGERWVLKSPGHIWSLGALLAEYPDALLVQTHRDPLAIVASLSSLISVLRRMYSDDTSIPEAAADFADDLILGLDRSVDAREDGTVSSERAVDVQFRAFMADPFVTIHEIYERLGLELTATTEARMRTFLAEHSREKHGVHEYTFGATELDAGEVRARTRRYVERFEVPEEPLR